MNKNLFLVVVLLMVSLGGNAFTSQDIYNRLMARKSMPKYKEGASWNSSNFYKNKVSFDGCNPGYHTGIECYSFMMDMMEYASDYKYAIRRVNGSYKSLPKIHVGDGIRLRNDRHSVVVLSVAPDGHTITAAEGNVNGGKVHWGRKINLADPKEGFTYLYTFWGSPTYEKNEPKQTPVKRLQPLNDRQDNMGVFAQRSTNGKSIEAQASIGSNGVSAVSVNGKNNVVSVSSNNSSTTVITNSQGKSSVSVSGNGMTTVFINGEKIEIEGNKIIINGRSVTLDGNNVNISVSSKDGETEVVQRVLE